MRMRHLTASVVALLTAAVLASGSTAPAWAAPQHTALPAARAVPAVRAMLATPAAPAARVISKNVLPETSIDGPALSSSFVPGGASASVVGWTGTDPAHHLNVETSTDGLTFGNKLTLGETSPFRPDVHLSVAGGPVTVAWTGTDPNHSLNVLYDVFGASPKKLTLFHESSISAPAVTLIGAFIFLAWTGTDPNHSLNVLPITFSGPSLVPGTKTVLSQFSSNAGPHLARRGANTIVLNWTSRTLQLQVATSQDGVHFFPASLPETSAFAPDTSSLEPFIGVSNREWIGWTGTDAAHHLNLQSTTTFPQFTNPASTKTTLADTAFGGPALDFNADEQIAWTGTDSAHHLNIAKYVFS